MYLKMSSAKMAAILTRGDEFINKRSYNHMKHI